MVNFQVSYQRLLEIELPITLKIFILSIIVNRKNLSKLNDILSLSVYLIALFFFVHHNLGVWVPSKQVLKLINFKRKNTLHFKKFLIFVFLVEVVEKKTLVFTKTAVEHEI